MTSKTVLSMVQPSIHNGKEIFDASELVRLEKKNYLNPHMKIEETENLIN
jgi:hypothetical protein